MLIYYRVSGDKYLHYIPMICYPSSLAYFFLFIDVLLQSKINHKNVARRNLYNNIMQGITLLKLSDRITIQFPC